MTVTPEVKQGVEEVRASFPGHVVEVVDEAQGGAYVVIRDLPIGGKYIPSTTWLGFLIPFQYPRADVYPHFVDASIVRVDNNRTRRRDQRTDGLAESIGAPDFP